MTSPRRASHGSATVGSLAARAWGVTVAVAGAAAGALKYALRTAISAIPRMASTRKVITALFGSRQLFLGGGVERGGLRAPELFLRASGLQSLEFGIDRSAFEHRELGFEG